MIIENGPQTSYERMIQAGRAISPKTPSVIEEAIEVVALKSIKDIFQAEKRAKGCGCRNCHRDVELTKEWYL